MKGILKPLNFRNKHNASEHSMLQLVKCFISFDPQKLRGGGKTGCLLPRFSGEEMKMQVDGVDGLKVRMANPGPTAEFQPDWLCSELPGFASSSATSCVTMGR